MLEHKTFNASPLEYFIACSRYRDEEGRLERNFEFDLASENGMLDHPKRALLYGKAYEKGGSLSEIVGYYEDLLELVI